MKIKRRSIISVILVISMMLTVLAFASCTKEEKEEEINVSITITGSGTNESNDTYNAVVKAVASEMTVLTATRQLCENLEITFTYDETLNSVIQIGSDKFDEGALAAEVVGEEETAETAEGEETSESEEAAEVETTLAPDTYYDWQCYVNGTEATVNDKIKDGDKIEWKWQIFTVTEE